MSTTLVPATQTPAPQSDHTYQPRLVPGYWLYDELQRDDPAELQRLMQEEQELYQQTSTPAYQEEVCARKLRSQEWLRQDITSGKFAQRAEEFHRLPSRDVSTKGKALAVLGIGTNSKPTMRIIKNTYRRKAKLLHPDVGGDAEAFKQLNAAYRILMQG